MNLEEFRKDFMEAVLARAAAEGDYKRAAFVSESCQRLAEAEEISDPEPCHHEGTGSRNRNLWIDAYAFDEMDATTTLITSIFQDSPEPGTINQTEAVRAFDALLAFLEDSLSGRLAPSLEESSPQYALATDLNKRHVETIRYRAILVTDGVMSHRIKNLDERIIDGRQVEFHIWDMNRFLQVFESSTGRDEIKVDFRDTGGKGIPCLEASQQDDGEYKAYLCIIPGNVIAETYDRFGSRLLEGNVRSFLSTRGKVNKKIRESILKEPGMFFAYNNGIAGTATDARLEHDGTGLRLLEATNFQIVNGGQTTVSLSLARRKDRASMENIFVQMKLSILSPERTDDVIPRIAYCANSQNKVSEADFFSNHPFHIRIESISRRLLAPATGGAQHGTYWFYERARGQHINEQLKKTDAEKKRFLRQNPKDQVITKTDLAKYENSWNQLPHLVSLGAQKNFIRFAEQVGEAWNRNETDFNEEWFRNAVAKAILFHKTERIVSSQPWYQNGYRANIVAYTVAKLSRMITQHGKGTTLDFRGIWNRQSISPATELQLATIAKAAFDCITTPISGIQNVTEWCKKQPCWKHLEDTDIPLLPEFVDELVAADDAKAIRQEGRRQQKIDTGIEAQSAVVKLGAPYWKGVVQWASGKKLLSGKDLPILQIAAMMPARIPSDKQSEEILKIRNRLLDLGLPE